MVLIGTKLRREKLPQIDRIHRLYQAIIRLLETMQGPFSAWRSFSQKTTVFE